METAPVLLAPPSGVGVRSGAPLTLRPQLAGSGQSVSWRREGQPLVGQNDFVLRFPAFTHAEAGAYQVLASNRLGSASSAHFSLQALGLSLAEWRLAHFGTSVPEGDAADTAAPAGDGLPNLLKFALGLEPATPSAARAPALAVPSTPGGAPVFEIRFDTMANGVALVVEGSDDLVGWTPLVTRQNGAAPLNAPEIEVAREPLPAEPGVDLLRVTLPAGEPRYFLRARAEPRQPLP